MLKIGTIIFLSYALFQFIFFFLGFVFVSLPSNDTSAFAFTKRLTKKKELFIALLVCRLAILLPYRIRENYIIVLHFFLHSMKNRFKVVFGGVNKVLVGGGLLISYLFYIFVLPQRLFARKKNTFRPIVYEVHNEKIY